MDKVVLNNIFKELLFIELVLDKKRKNLGKKTFHWFRELSSTDISRNRYLELLEKVRSDCFKMLVSLSNQVSSEIGHATRDLKLRQLALLEFTPYKGILKRVLAYVYPHLKGSNELNALVRQLKLEDYNEDHPEHVQPSKVSSQSPLPLSTSLSANEQLLKDIENMEHLLKQL